MSGGQREDLKTGFDYFYQLPCSQSGGADLTLRGVGITGQCQPESASFKQGNNLPGELLPLTSPTNGMEAPAINHKPKGGAWHLLLQEVECLEFAINPCCLRPPSGFCDSGC